MYIPLVFGIIIYIFSFLDGIIVYTVSYGQYSINSGDIGGLIGEVIGIILSVAMIGIGSGFGGLNDSSTKIIIKTVGLALLWAMLSINIIIFITPLGYIGYILYAILTIIYILGLVMDLGG